MFHVKLTATARGYPSAVHSESWVDAEVRKAREETEGKVVTIYTQGCAVMARGGHLGHGGQLTKDSRSPLLASALAYLKAIDSGEAGAKVEAVSLSGVPAIRIRMPGVRIFLDQSYLPLRMELDQASPAVFGAVVKWEADFLQRESLPSDFFSTTALPDEDLSNSFPQCKVTE